MFIFFIYLFLVGGAGFITDRVEENENKKLPNNDLGNSNSALIKTHIFSFHNADEKQILANSYCFVFVRPKDQLFKILVYCRKKKALFFFFSFIPDDNESCLLNANGRVLNVID